MPYLVIREGAKWTDVVRLTIGRTITMGRASTNQIVINDERASRAHAEVFYTEGNWVLRDLDSRNGTIVNNEPLHGDMLLNSNDRIHVANYHISFVEDLSSAFPENPEPDTGVLKDHLGDSTDDNLVGDSHVLEYLPPTTITHRKNQTKMLERAQAHSSDKMGQAFAALCRIAFDLAGQPDATGIANTAINGLLEGTAGQAAGILLGTGDDDADLVGADLEVIGSKSQDDEKYQRVTGYLAATVLEGGEAVLARNVGDDSALAGRDSKGEILLTSVICAPIRFEGVVLGLVHLYSLDSNQELEPDDLEFALAVADNVGLAINNLYRERDLEEDLSMSRNEIQQLRTQLGEESEIVGVSAALEQVKQNVMQAAPSRATVLIRGESGVGKELIARAVHFASPRQDGPFVCLNCAALSESLLESELFGHEKGAFTGATERKIGKFESADQGTLMLDEIGEMSPSIQAKFLRVLEGHPFERVGGNQPIEVDVRVIAATNRDLEVAVAEGRFRRDLYFRLHVVEILVPPLRKRPEDVELLAYHFLDRFKAETGRQLSGFSKSAMDQLRKYRWPGNVRELKNMVERAVVLCRSDEIGVDNLTLSNLSTASESTEIDPLDSGSYRPMSLSDIERIHIQQTLEHNEWNKSRTATILGVERSTLDRKIKRYNIRRSGD